MSARDRSSNRRYFSPVVLRLAELRWDTKSTPVEGHRVWASTTARVREIGSQFGRNEILHDLFARHPQLSKDRIGSWPPLFEFARYRISYAFPICIVTPAMYCRVFYANNSSFPSLVLFFSLKYASGTTKLTSY